MLLMPECPGIVHLLIVPLCCVRSDMVLAHPVLLQLPTQSGAGRASTLMVVELPSIFCLSSRYCLVLCLDLLDSIDLLCILTLSQKQHN